MHIIFATTRAILNHALFNIKHKIVSSSTTLQNAQIKSSETSNAATFELNPDSKEPILCVYPSDPWNDFTCASVSISRGAL